MTIALRIEDLSFSYDRQSRQALDLLDLSVEAGEFCALLGPNGAGKSTLMAAILGFVVPASGTINLYGQDRGRYAKTVGYVPQEIALYESLTARENLEFFAAMAGLKSQQWNLRIPDLADRVGLSDRLQCRVSDYSGGMKRRLNLASGLLADPDFLLLDEPTVGVDPQSRLAIIELLHELHKKGKTIIYATHYLDEAEKIASDLALMDAGKIKVKEKMTHFAGTNLEEKFFDLTGRKLRD